MTAPTRPNQQCPAKTISSGCQPSVLVHGGQYLCRLPSLALKQSLLNSPLLIPAPSSSPCCAMVVQSFPLFLSSLASLIIRTQRLAVLAEAQCNNFGACWGNEEIGK